MMGQADSGSPSSTKNSGALARARQANGKATTPLLASSERSEGDSHTPASREVLPCGLAGSYEPPADTRSSDNAYVPNDASPAEIDSANLARQLQMDQLGLAERRSEPQKFRTGARVHVKRSNGEESIAFVTEYDEVGGVYTVAIDTIGSGVFKHARVDMLRAAPVKQVFLMGTQVLVKRSNGTESIAWVHNFKSDTGVYVVEVRRPAARCARPPANPHKP